MSLDPRPSDAELVRIAEGRRQVLAAGRVSAWTSVTITVPWEHLVPDNAKYGVMVQKGRARMLLKAEYRAAKDCIQHIARRAMGTAQPFEGIVDLYAKLYVPDLRRRDATNYCKICHDSIQGAVLVDDTQIKKATWENVGVDRENPRCEITVTKRAA